MSPEMKILYLSRKDGNYHSKVYVKWGKLGEKVQFFAVKGSATREKRKLNSLFPLILNFKNERKKM